VSALVGYYWTDLLRYFFDMITGHHILP